MARARAYAETLVNGLILVPDVKYATEINILLLNLYLTFPDEQGQWIYQKMQRCQCLSKPD